MLVIGSSFFLKILGEAFSATSDYCGVQRIEMCSHLFAKAERGIQLHRIDRVNHHTFEYIFLRGLGYKRVIWVKHTGMMKYTLTTRLLRYAAWNSGNHCHSTTIIKALLLIRGLPEFTQLSLPDKLLLKFGELLELLQIMGSNITWGENLPERTPHDSRTNRPR